MKKFFTFFAAVLFAGSMMAADLLNIDFKAGQGDWTIDNKELGGLEFVWAQTTQYGMKATGYVNSANHETEAWLISPAVDMSAITEATLSFSHARRYGDLSQLSVQAKAGEGEWTILEVSAWPDGSSWNYIDATADLSDFAGQANVQVAFVYTSSATAGATWEIASAAISEGEAPEPPAGADVVFTSADFNGQGTSQTGSEVTATKDGVTFTCNKAFGDQYGVRCYKNSNVTITSAEQQIGKIVFEFATVSGTYYNGGLDEENVVNAMEWSAESLASQARMNKISIYFGEYTPVDPPVVTIDTVNVAEAVAIGMALEDNAKTTVDYVVKGHVVQAYAPNEGYSDQTWFMADVAGAFGEFEAYRCTPDYLVETGDYVYVKGKIQKYVKDSKTQIEIGNGTATHGEALEGIENILLNEKVSKVIVDGVVYIVRDGKMFNLQGAQVR